MWDNLGSALIAFGFPGIGLVATCWYILQQDKKHEKERDEWRKTIDGQFESNATILTRIETLLETMIAKNNNRSR